MEMILMNYINKCFRADRVFNEYLKPEPGVWI